MLKGEKISQNLSEVDLSNPEDVKAPVPDHPSEVLVHFGEENFLDRYKKYEAHLSRGGRSIRNYRPWTCGMSGRWCSRQGL